MKAAKSETVVVASLDGGLGNQMFQYAAARRLAHVRGAELVLWLGDRFPPGTARPYGLNHFAIKARIAAAHEAAYGFKRITQARRVFDRLRGRYAAKQSLRVIEERTFKGLKPAPGAPLPPESDRVLFMPEILNLPGNTQLKGYWQNERYFADIEAIIRREFTIKTPPDERNRQALARITASPSVFLHVRRGDYLAPAAAKFYGACGPDYYSGALAMLRQRVGQGLQVYVFSDDPAWVRAAQIGGKEAMVVDWNAENPVQDMALMQACDHAIIANSSFSWWGAWLGEKPGRSVIAPRIWYQAVPHYRDIVPARWIKL